MNFGAGALLCPHPERAHWDPSYICVSASRLKMIGGDKGEPGCERKYLGAYGFGLKQSGSSATELGTDVHTAGEVFQETGMVPDPEGDAGRIFRAGAELVGVSHLEHICGPLLVEYEHRGFLPDGTPFLARLDGHSPRGGLTHCVVIQDLKTTSNPRYALVSDADSPSWLGADLQALFYAGIILVIPHWYAKPLPEGHMGPAHWKWWDPDAQDARSARLRWLYFLSRGVPRAWDVSVFVSRADAAQQLADRIMPLVEKMTALHAWRDENPQATVEDLSQIDRNLDACSRKGRWCGVAEHDKCEFGAIGTPIIQLRTQGPRKMTTPQDRLAALRARQNGGAALTSAPVTTPAQPPVTAATPPKESLSPEVSTSGTAAVVAPVLETVAPSDAAPEADNTPASAGRKGRPRGSKNAPKADQSAAPQANGAAALPDAPPGSSRVNPPEVVEAIAQIKAAAELTAQDPAEFCLRSIPLETLCKEIARRFA